jgi:nitrate/nitrite transporter NarK
LKIVVSFVALNLATSASSNYVELIAFLFILPSALFSGYAGHLADVYSKRTILVTVKLWEIAIMVFALTAFFFWPDSTHVGCSVLDGAARRVLQSGQVRHPARNAAGERICRAVMDFWK